MFRFKRVGELTPRLGSDAAIEFRCGFARQDFYCARGDMESRIKEIVLSLPGQSHWHFVIAGGGKVSVDELLASRSSANLWVVLPTVINTPTASFTGLQRSSWAVLH